jgi:hypothetical protein
MLSASKKKRLLQNAEKKEKENGKTPSLTLEGE